MSVFKLRKTQLRSKVRKTEGFCISLTKFLVRSLNRKMFLIIYWGVRLGSVSIRKRV